VTPRHAIRREQLGLDALSARSRRAIQNGLMQRQLTLARLSSNLDHLSPEGVLARGYSIVQLENGAVVQNASTLQSGDNIRIRLHRGHVRATVRTTTPD